MSALDDAIAAHLAHPAGGCGDPLSEALLEQAQGVIGHAPVAHGPVVLREGWEDEPVRVPHLWWFYLLCFVAGCLLSGCGGSFDKDEEPPPDEHVRIPAQRDCTPPRTRCL